MLAPPLDGIRENLRPGTMRDLGLAPEDLLRENERLVYAAISGWGQDGPYADRDGATSAPSSRSSRRSPRRGRWRTWLDCLRAEGVPCGEIQDYGQVFAGRSAA